MNTENITAVAAWGAVTLNNLIQVIRPLQKVVSTLLKKKARKLYVMHSIYYAKIINRV